MGEGRVEGMVARHEATLLRVADQFSLCHDDALDAYQRALEIFLRRMESVDPATEGAWMRVVVKHEAMAIRRVRQASVARETVDFDEHLPASLRELEDAVAGGERVERSAEALRALKPDEARALLLKAEGMSYEEIGTRFGWTYTKVNRSIAEGRKRFLNTFAGIESGEACARHAPVIAALGSGSASTTQMVSIRPHLRHCAACRAQVRDLRSSRLRRLLLFWPFGWLLRADVLQVATATGGGRFAPAAALFGLCLGGGMAGAACMMTGALPAPPLIGQVGGHTAPAPAKAHSEPHAAIGHTASATPTPAGTPRTILAVATPVPVATAAPAKRHSTVKAKAASTHKVTVRKSSSSSSSGEFGFESHTGSSGPASSPAVTASTASVHTTTPTTHHTSGGGGSSSGEFGFEGG